MRNVVGIVGVDVDGVLTNIDQFQIEYGKKYFKKTDDEIDKSKSEIEDIFHVSKEEAAKFWIKYIWKYAIKEPLRQDMVDCINKLHDNEYEVQIITSRANTTRQDALGALFRKMLVDKLKEYNLKYDGICYCGNDNTPEEKAKYCKELGVSVMLEDTGANAEEISKECTVLLVDSLSNKDVKDSKNIIRVSNGNEVYKYMKSLDSSLRGKAHVKEDKYDKTYRRVRNIGTIIFKTGLNPTIIDKENIPKDGPILLCGNHLHVWDQFPVICATKRTIHWMAKKEYFDSKLGPFFRKTGAICVDRYGNAKESELEALEYLENNGAIGLFPEGTRNKLKETEYEGIYELIDDQCNRDEITKSLSEKSIRTSQVNKLKELLISKRIDKDTFKEILLSTDNDILIGLLEKGIITEEEYNDSLLLPFKFGAVSMAKKTEALIVPFGVTGDYKVGNDNLIVNIGEPIDVRDKSYEEANTELRNKVLGLVLDNYYRKRK